jgi:DNA-binding HxlR family transcriptional regulator
MPKLKPNLSVCSAARALELLGDRWTLLLVREVLFGTHRFDDFASHLGIARNVLTLKLAALVEAGILEQRPFKQDAKRLVYHLTEKGSALVPVLVALVQWGDQWLQTPQSVPMRIIERETGLPVAAVRVRNVQGKELQRHELDWAPGPGAGHPSFAPLAAAYEAQRRALPRPVPAAETAAGAAGASDFSTAAATAAVKSQPQGSTP